LSATGATPQLQKQVVSLQETIKTLTVRNVEEYERGVNLVRHISDLRKQIEETFNPIVAKAYAAHKEAVAQRDKFLKPLDINRAEVDRKLLTFKSEQERKRRDEERRLAEEARRKAEADALAEAAELERNGEKELAAQIVEQQIVAPAPVVSVPTTVPKVAGFTTQKIWRWKITNESQIPREYLMVDEVKIGRVVRAMKDAAVIPGIRVYDEDTARH